MKTEIQKELKIEWLNNKIDSFIFDQAFNTRDSVILHDAIEEITPFSESHIKKLVNAFFEKNKTDYQIKILSSFLYNHYSNKIYFYRTIEQGKSFSDWLFN